MWWIYKNGFQTPKILVHRASKWLCSGKQYLWCLMLVANSKVVNTLFSKRERSNLYSIILWDCSAKNICKYGYFFYATLPICLFLNYFERLCELIDSLLTLSFCGLPNYQTTKIQLSYLHQLALMSSSKVKTLLYSMRTWFNGKTFNFSWKFHRACWN